MEYPIKKPIYLEFYGMPGGGKSTVSHAVSHKLRKKGFDVSEPSYDIDHHNKPSIKKLKKLYVLLEWLFFHNSVYKRVKAIVVCNGYSGISMIEQTSNVLQKISVYLNNCREQIIIWDQGLVQAAISLSIKGMINASDNLKYLYAIIGNEPRTINILIDVDDKVAHERMSLRKTNDSRIEKLHDDNQKHKMLSLFQKEIFSIQYDYKTTVIDGSLLLEKQVELVLNAVMNDGSLF